MYKSLAKMRRVYLLRCGHENKRKKNRAPWRYLRAVVERQGKLFADTLEDRASGVFEGRAMATLCLRTSALIANRSLLIANSEVNDFAGPNSERRLYEHKVCGMQPNVRSVPPKIDMSTTKPIKSMEFSFSVLQIRPQIRHRT